MFVRLWFGSLLVLSACVPTVSSGGNSLPSPLLLTAAGQPALFLRPEPDAALIGFVSEEVPLELAGSAEHGRVPVRVEGPLRARGYVPAELLTLRVQRRGRVRGTPVYVGPNDRVQVLGVEADGKRLRVRVTPRALGQPPSSYEGSYPREGLGAQRAAIDTPPPDLGRVYQVPAQLAVPLFEAPGGPLVAELAPQRAPYEVRVVNVHDGWLAVRVGSGPYLVGWTHVRLAEQTKVGPAAQTTASAVGEASDKAGETSPALVAVVDPSDPSAPSAAGGGAVSSPPLGPSAARDPQAIPLRLVTEPGELKRVAAHTKVVFGEQVIGVFKTEGWARVIAVYPSGYCDVFAAADDQLAIRGLVRAIDLLPVDAIGTSTPAAVR